MLGDDIIKSDNFSCSWLKCFNANGQPAGCGQWVEKGWDSSINGGRDTTKSSRLTLTSECGIVAPRNTKYQIQTRVDVPNRNENIPWGRASATRMHSPRKKRKTKTMSNTSKSSSDFPTRKTPTPMQMAGKSTEKSQQKVAEKKYIYVCMYVDAKENVGGEKVKGKNVEGKSAVLAKMENDVKCKLTAFNINSKTIGELHAREMKCQRERSKINFPRHECIRQRRQPYNLSIPLSLFRAFSLTERSPCNTSTSFD